MVFATATRRAPARPDAAPGFVPALPPLAPVVAIVGTYGTGKTEVAVNLARALATAGDRVRVADLDIVNPYFRCREARDALEALGIGVVVPPGDVVFSDIPILVPAIRGMVAAPGGRALLDVGGEASGARALACVADLLGGAPHDVLFVANARRPFTHDATSTLDALRRVEESARVRVTGLVSNTHLLDDTTADVVAEGIDVAREAAARAGVPLVFAAAAWPAAAEIDPHGLGCPLLRMRRMLLPPHLAVTEA